MQVILDAAAGKGQFSFLEDEWRCFTPVTDLASAVMDLCFHDYAGSCMSLDRRRSPGMTSLAGPPAITALTSQPGEVERSTEATCTPAPPTLFWIPRGSAGLLTTRIRPVGEVLANVCRLRTAVRGYEPLTLTPSMTRLRPAAQRGQPVEVVADLDHVEQHALQRARRS